ncbi:hypothetical protein C0Q70_12198 [Pomacea canaliculata]|uniref:Uncharacterized protein n=1 Tax=Pomacea canaliculata TaxID=400727 RepID=A0A2T7P0U5_POMCA|nr:hypothetical protein C0Q70_12198 [Pomacea canaliculata]
MGLQLKYTKGFLAAMCRLLKNPVYMTQLVSACFTIFAVAGAQGFTPNRRDADHSLSGDIHGRRPVQALQDGAASKSQVLSSHAASVQRRQRPADGIHLPTATSVQQSWTSGNNRRNRRLAVSMAARAMTWTTFLSAERTVGPTSRRATRDVSRTLVEYATSSCYKYL